MSSIFSLSSSGFPYPYETFPPATSRGLSQLIQDIQSIGGALQSGGLSTARSALGTFQPGQPSVTGNAQTSASQPPPSPTTNSTQSADGTLDVVA